MHFFLPANEDFDWWASHIYRDCRICNVNAIPELKKTCQNLNSISSSISTSSSYSSWPKSASAAKSPSSTSPFLRTTPTFFLVPAMSMGETPLNFGLNQIFWYSETISISNYLRQIELLPWHLTPFCQSPCNDKHLCWCSRAGEVNVNQDCLSLRKVNQQNKTKVKMTNEVKKSKRLLFICHRDVVLGPMVRMFLN